MNRNDFFCAILFKILTNLTDVYVIKSLCREKVESWAKNCEMPLYYQECRCICVTNMVIFISFILWHGTFNKAKKGVEVRKVSCF